MKILFRILIYLSLAFLVVYLYKFDYLRGKCLIKVPFASLVNLVAGRQVVTEIIQRDVTPERLSQEVLSLLRDNAGRENMIKDLKEVKNALGGSGAAERAADLAMELISGTCVA